MSLKIVCAVFIIVLCAWVQPTRGKDIELLDSSYWKEARAASEKSGHTLLDIEASFPSHSWKHEIVHWGFSHDGVMMAVTLLTPRARAVHAAGVALADGEPFDSTTFDPELFNNGVLFVAGQRLSMQALSNGDFLEIVDVTCELPNDSLVEPIVVVLDSAAMSSARYDRQTRCSLRALFPVSLFDGSSDLKFHVYFRHHETKTIRLSKRTVRDLY